MTYVFVTLQWICLLFFVGLNLGYILLNVLSYLSLPRYIKRQVLAHLPEPHTSFGLPISIVIAAYNEESVVAASIRSLLQLNYPNFEIVVVNDGSKDNTLEVLKKEFELVKMPVTFRRRVKHQTVRGVYQSAQYQELRVIDKENGGAKSDAINAGINAARFSLFLPLDADTILERDSLRLMVQPFLENPHTIATGGSVRIANGCEVSGGYLTRVGVPGNLIALFQIIEYFRAFLFGRVGWSAINALPLISGAFGLFHKESVISVGGYRHDTLGEDMELVLRLHREFRLKGKPYRITFVADAACWTEAPESLKVLKRQRVRWQRGLMESLSMNRQLFFHPKSGFLGWLTLPFLLIFEGLSPVIEVGGYVAMLFCFIFGFISLKAFAAFMLLAIGLGLLLSFTSILLEEISFRTYPKTKHLLVLFGGAILENLGYRQLNAFWRLEGLIRWLMKSEAKWGNMTRTASWRAELPENPNENKLLTTAEVNFDLAADKSKEKTSLL
ncbi:MAG TPA: glycosyltransferase [Pyrinomonadaceae bacterium]|jgi:cellulose synthase/poly-beta-1,6-N-acetylglucosamine synthase-like glycosyltransferase